MSNEENKNQIKKKIIVESLAVFVIAMVPIFFKLYEYFPGPGDANALGPISFLGLEIKNNGFDSIATNIWFYTQKVIPLLLFIIWFFTSKDWWYHILIIPIATYAFQLFELFFSDDYNIDTDNIWWLLPVCMVVIPFVYFIRIKLYDKYVHGIDLEAIDAELQELKEKQELKSVTSEKPENLNEASVAEEIDRKLSTENLEHIFKQLQNRLQNWLNLKF